MIIAISVTLLFLVVRFTVTLFNFISNPKLTRVNRHYTDLVSILIPVRDEAHNILTLLESIQNQDYKNYEVIVYDDESTDGTYEACAAFAGSHQRFKIVKGDKLPVGWTGKNYACHQLAKEAKGKYFLFTDADAFFKNGLINSSVHRMQLYNLGLISLFTKQVMKTTGEKATVPIMDYILLNLLPLRLVFLIKNATIATASGQFMLFDANAYKLHKWHEQVKEKAACAIEIMKLVKTVPLNGETLLANGMICCRSYNRYDEAIKGISRNFLSAFNDSIFAVLTYILIVIGGPILIITTLDIPLIFFMSGLILLTRIMTSLAAGQNAFYNVLLHPVQMFNMVVIAFLSIQNRLTNKMVWKGRSV